MLPSFINVYHPTVSRQCTTLSCLPVGSMYAIYIYIYGNMDPINVPPLC